VQQCTVIDISSGGARLELEDIRAIPDTFSLLLSKFGQQRYQCSVVWKAAAEVGVEFIKPAPTTADEWVNADAPRPVPGGLHAHAGLAEPALAYTAAHGVRVVGLLRRLSERLGRQIFAA